MAYRYLGNKTRLANWIVDVIASIVPAMCTVADPMCGTASVSEALALHGFSVVAADALTFPIVHATSRLLIKQEPSFLGLGGYEAAIHTLNSLEPQEGYFYQEFGSKGRPAERDAPRLYFSSENAGKIDSMRSFIRGNYEAGNLTEYEHATLLQNLILSVNAVANISGTYGYFLARLSKAALQPIVIRPLRFINTPGKHKVIHGPIEETAPILGADAVYLDPPYTKRQYAGNYHILETIACEDEPEAKGDGGLRPWKDDASAFCYRKSAGSALDAAIRNLDAEDVFLSYSEDGQIGPEQVLEILASHGKVTIYEHEYTRYRSNRHAQTGCIVEKLYHLHKE